MAQYRCHTLATLTAQRPEFSCSALVRTIEKAEQVKAATSTTQPYLSERAPRQTLSSVNTADASDRVGAAKAITAGLVAGDSKQKPGYWLHMGGTGILTFEDNDKNQYGNRSDKCLRRLGESGELLTLPEHGFHRNVDQLVLEAGIQHADVLRTALVCPPTIYGRGRGPCSQRGRQVYELANVTLRLQKGPIIGAGQSIWNNVHVHDLSDVYVLVVDAAVAGRTDDGLWGAKEYAGFESLSWGTNSRGRSQRARELLGWRPHRPSLLDELPEIVQSEHRRLQEST